jgi:hypothetical protein
MALGLGNNIGDIREYTLATPILKAPTTCIDMDGTLDMYYWVSGDPPIDEEKGFSLVACVNTDSVGAYDTVIGWHPGSIPRRACCFVVGGSRYQFGCLQGSSTSWDDDGEGVKTTSSVLSDTWYHLVGTGIWSDAGGWDIKFYLNGVAQTGSWSTSGYPENGFTKISNMSVGLWDSSGSGSPSRWNGRANMIACYQGVLNTDQVSFLYNNGVPRSPAHILTTVPSVHAEIGYGASNDLQAYWKFSELQAHGAASQDSEFSGTPGYRLYAYNAGTITSDYMGS